MVRYFPIQRRNLTEALDIFIRANNGGVHVTAAEMIFATIIAHWPGGRDSIETFQHNLNATGNKFNLDISRVLLGILAVAGQPIQFRVESFKPATVEQIRNQFERITSRLFAAAERFDKWGLSGNDHAVNPNALIALALLLEHDIDVIASDEDLRQFVIRSLLCEFYRRPETSLRRIREYASEHLHPGECFFLTHMEEHLVLPSGKTLQVGTDLLEELLMVPIGDRRCYILLALIHPHHAKHQHQFHKDHLHPRAAFDRLQELELDSDKQGKWYDWRDRLPNLQLLQGAENNFKRAKPLKQWLECEFTDLRSREVFLNQNDIPLDLDLDFGYFEEFFQARKGRLRSRLQKALNIKLGASIAAEGMIST